jgi:hypothetical protein
MNFFVIKIKKIIEYLVIKIKISIEFKAKHF